MKKMLIKFLIGNQVKGRLDKLPLNYKKTYAGLIIVTLTYALSSLDSGTDIYAVTQVVRDILVNTEGVEVITDPHTIRALTEVIAYSTGVVYAGIGIIHKGIKKLAKAYEYYI